MSIVSKEDLLNKQTEAKNTLKSFTCRVLVCSGTGCIASGAQKIYDEMMRESGLGKRGNAERCSACRCC